MQTKKYKVFQPTDRSMFITMIRSEMLIRRFNNTRLWNVPKRNRLFKKIVAHIDGKPFCIMSPIHFQQGNNLYIGKNFYCGYNFVVLDHARVDIGNNVMIAPNVTISTAAHPKIAEQRIVRPFKNVFEPYGRGEIEIISPVKIGDNVWIASGAIICPGVTIGNNSIIGAGSVVTKDIPPDVFACGVPAKVIRNITSEDKIEIDL